MKKIIYNEEAQKALKKGVDTASDLARITIGSKGRNVVIDSDGGDSFIITNDAKTIINSINLDDRFENLGVKVLRDVVLKTDEFAKGGRTAAVILTSSIFNEGLKHTMLGVNVMGVKSGIEMASRDISIALKKMAKPVKTIEDIKNVATISSESVSIGTLVAEIINALGTEGKVTVEDSQSADINYEIVDGLEFNKGYISPYMINNDKMESELSDVPILVTNKKISVYKDIFPLIEALANNDKKALVIIADDVDGDALEKCILNRLRANFPIICIKAPEYGEKKNDFLEDICLMTGATMGGYEIANLGRARKVISTKDTTKIIGGKLDKHLIKEKITQLKNYKEETQVKYEKDKAEERIARLMGKIGVIRVGASTEADMKRIKQKVEDAVAEAKAALEEGIVVGGGVSLVRITESLKIPKNATEEQKIGYNIVLKALESPITNIARNAGRDDTSVIIHSIKQWGKDSGYNSTKDEVVVDMIADGVIDAVKIIRIGVESACSGAATLLTMGAAMAQVKEKNDTPR